MSLGDLNRFPSCRCDVESLVGFAEKHDKGWLQAESLSHVAVQDVHFVQSLGERSPGGAGDKQVSDQGETLEVEMVS